MKSSLALSTLLILVTPVALAAQGTCDKVKETISQRIISNGVPESGFSLTIAPSDQATPADAQVVGHCASDSQKILYTRNRNSNPSPASDQATPQASSEDDVQQ